MLSPFHVPHYGNTVAVEAEVQNSLAGRLVAAVGDLGVALGGLVEVLLVLADHLDTTLLVGDNADGLIVTCQSSRCYVVLRMVESFERGGGIEFDRPGV